MLCRQLGHVNTWDSVDVTMPGCNDEVARNGSCDSTMSEPRSVDQVTAHMLRAHELRNAIHHTVDRPDGVNESTSQESSDKGNADEREACIERSVVSRDEGV